MYLSHGTRCAGEVSGARDNGVCGVGVAYDSMVAGIITLPNVDAKLFDNYLGEIYEKLCLPFDLFRSCFLGQIHGIPQILKKIIFMIHLEVQNRVIIPLLYFRNSYVGSTLHDRLDRS